MHDSKDAEARHFDFYFPALDNHLRVEASRGGVRIRSTRDNFSDIRKRYFIRELEAEGYIEDRFDPVDWVIDRSWMPIPQRSRQADRFMCRLFAVAATLWLVFVGLVLLQAR
jgi:hypothetical protein